MPVVNKGGNTVTPGAICYSCIKLETGECPYGNKYGASTLVFQGDPGTNTCSYYENYPSDVWASEENKMKKNAEKMSEAQLNLFLYKKVMALGQDEAKKLFNYWTKVFPPGYADDMTSDYNETRQRDTEDKETPPRGQFKSRERKTKYKDKRLKEKTKDKFYD